MRMNFRIAAVLVIQRHDGMAGGAGPAEEVENNTMLFTTYFKIFA